MKGGDVTLKLVNGFGSVTKLKRKTTKPYWARGGAQYKYDEKKEQISEYRPSLGCFKTQPEAFKAVEDFYKNKSILKNPNIKYKELFEKFCDNKFLEVKDKSIYNYNHAFNISKKLHDIKVTDIKLSDLQDIIDTCEKNYPTLKIIKLLYNETFKFARMHRIITYDPSEFINIKKHKDKNPNKQKREKFDDEMVNEIWNKYQTKEDATVLMLIYSGVRITELLNLKKEDVFLEENYFNIIDSKTFNGIRSVPIAKKIKPFFEEWLVSSDENYKYLLYDKNKMHIEYSRYRREYYDPFVGNVMKSNLTPHCCRHTCISKLTSMNVNSTIIKKIVGHSGAMNLTERVYTHFDIQELIDAINLI